MLKAGLLSFFLHLGLGVWAVGHRAPSASSVPSSRVVELVTVDAATSTSPRRAREVKIRREVLGARQASLPQAPSRQHSSTAVTTAEALTGADKSSSSVPGSTAGETQVELEDVVAWGNHAPDYPREALARGWEGRVKLRLMLDPTGRVRAGEIAERSSHAILDEAALRAALQWRVPLEDLRDGVLVVPIHFRLQE